MWASLQTPLLFGLIAAAFTSLGLIAVALRADWGERYARLFGLIAAGMLATLVFLHVLPKAFEIAARAPIWVAFGFFAGLMMSATVAALSANGNSETAHKSSALTPVLAIAAHSFIDGIVYAVNFAQSYESGVLAVSALIVHELPEGVIAFVLLKKSGVATRSALLFAFLAAAATTPLGVLVSGPFMASISAEALGALYAVSAGLLLYVATGPLLGPLKEVQPVRGLMAVSVGIAVAIALVNLPFVHSGHSHGHEDHDHAHPHEHVHFGHSFRD